MNESQPSRITFSFYGVGVSVESNEDTILQWLDHDFSFFSAHIDKSDLRIIYHSKSPDYSGLPVMTSSLATPRNICFHREDETYIDYFGKALNIYNKSEGICHIYTENLDLAHEISYLTVLSRVSEKLDQKRLHRIHALGIAHNHRGILIMLPCGGGKTTLAMSILRSPDDSIKLISEDSPLIRRDGTLLPFPLRIGVLPQSLPDGIDKRFIRFNQRMEFDPKVSIDIRYFAEKIASDEVKPSIILLGRRSTGDLSQITPASKLSVIKHCLMNSVLGVGLYQGMEFMMQKNALEVARQSRILFSRIYNNMRLVIVSKVFSFIIGRNISKNYEVLLQFLKHFPENGS